MTIIFAVSVIVIAVISYTVTFLYLPIYPTNAGDYYLEIIFEEEIFIDIGDKVISSGGATIGYVKRIDTVLNNIRTVVKIINGYQIPIGSEFIADSQKLTGPHIRVEPSDSGKVITPDSVIKGKRGDYVHI